MRPRYAKNNTLKTANTTTRYSKRAARRLLAASDFQVIAQGVGQPLVNTVEQQASGVQALTDSLLSGNTQPTLDATIAQAFSQAPFPCECLLFPFDV